MRLLLTETQAASSAEAPDEVPDPDCGVCGGGLIRVEHQETSRGRTYDRFFCPRCGYAIEVLGTSASTDGGPAA